MGESVDALAPEPLLSDTCVPVLLDYVASVAPVCTEPTMSSLETDARLSRFYDTSASRRCDLAFNRNTNSRWMRVFLFTIVPLFLIQRVSLLVSMMLCARRRSLVLFTISPFLFGPTRLMPHCRFTVLVSAFSLLRRADMSITSMHILYDVSVL